MGDFEEIHLGEREKGRKSGFVVAAITFVVYFGLFDGPAVGYWDTYIAVPASLVSGMSVDFRKQNGKPEYEYTLSGSLPEDLINKDAYGIATKDQRLAPAVVAAPFFRLFNVFGFRLFFALVPALTALIFFGLVHRVTGRRWLAVASAAILVMNPFVLSFERLNANFPAVLMISALFLLLETPPLRPFVAGLLLGALGAVRNEAVIFVPILLYWVYFKAFDAAVGSKTPVRRSAALKAAGLLVAGAAITIAPILYWKQYAFGSPFMHPSQYSHFEGFRPTFPHSLLGIHFDFNGLLNYPFIDTAIRTPHFPHPVFLLIPLVLLRSFGLLVSCLTLLGIGAAWRADRRRALCLLSWILLTFLLFAFQENWEELKMSFIMLMLPPLVVLAAHGATSLTQLSRFVPNVLGIATLAIFLAVFLKFSFHLEYPADSRWYQRFPKAAVNASRLDGLPRDERLDPEFFLTRETDEERLVEKQRLSEVCLLPCSYLPVDGDVEHMAERVKTEFASRRLSVSNVWNLIYAQQSRPRK